MEDMQLLVSGILVKEGRKIVRVSFLRDGDYAEFIVPDGVLDKQKGFTEEEVTGLYRYVRENKDQILREARGVNAMRNWLGINSPQKPKPSPAAPTL